jgi:predicted phosphodiesterase
MTFTVVNDIHGQSDMLEQMLTQAEVQKNDLVFFNGDMLSEYEKEEDIFVGFMEALKSSIFRDAPFKVAICHEPPRKDGQYGMGEILTKFVPLLNEAGIDVMLSGHLHQHIKEVANSQVKFPVLINSNTAYVKGSAIAKTLNLEVFTLDGKKADAILIKK